MDLPPPPTHTHFSGEHTRIESENEGKGILHVLTFSHLHPPTHGFGIRECYLFLCFCLFQSYVTCLFDRNIICMYFEVLFVVLLAGICTVIHVNDILLDFFILYYTSYRVYSSRIHQIILNNLKLMGTELFKHVKDKPIKIHNASIWWCAYHLKWIVGPTCLKLRKWLL